VATCLCGTSDRLDSPGLSRPRDCLRRIITPPSSWSLPRLLSRFENSPFARQGCSETPASAASRTNRRHSTGRRTSSPIRTTSRLIGGPFLQHLVSPNESAILEEPRFSRRSPRNDGESLGQNGFGLLASRRPNGGLSLCPMEFLVVTPGAALGRTLKNFHSLRSVTCWNIIVSCLKKTLRVHKSSTFSTKAQQGTVVYESRL